MPCACVQGIEGGAQADGALSLTEDDLLVGPSDGHGKQADGRIILDDIDWDVISSRHGARSAPQCLTKWYTQLAPSMVSKGEAHTHTSVTMVHSDGMCVVLAQCVQCTLCSKLGRHFQQAWP